MIDGGGKNCFRDYAELIVVYGAFTIFNTYERYQPSPFYYPVASTKRSAIGNWVEYS